MTTPPNKNQTSLQLLRAYIAWIRDLYADDLGSVDSLLLVLRIYKCLLVHYSNPAKYGHPQLSTLKHGIREAELILRDIWADHAELMAGWYMGCKAANPVQRLANILWELIMVFTREIGAVEAMFPELKSEFDRERAEYRRILNERDEALEIE